MYCKPISDPTRTRLINALLKEAALMELSVGELLNKMTGITDEIGCRYIDEPARKYHQTLISRPVKKVIK